MIKNAQRIQWKQKGQLEQSIATQMAIEQKAQHRMMRDSVEYFFNT